MSKENPTELEKFQSAVLTSAVDAVSKEMSPEQMRALATHFIEEALKSLKSPGYGSIVYFIQQQMEVMLKEYVKTPAVVQLVQAAVEQGVQEALKELPAGVRGKVVEKALAAVANVITADRSR